MRLTCLRTPNLDHCARRRFGNTNRPSLPVTLGFHLHMLLLLCAIRGERKKQASKHTNKNKQTQQLNHRQASIATNAWQTFISSHWMVHSFGWLIPMCSCYLPLNSRSDCYTTLWEGGFTLDILPIAHNVFQFGEEVPSGQVTKLLTLLESRSQEY